jgi:dTDP-4-amino-4,6-dideoxyglucose formyltransferase
MKRVLVISDNPKLAGVLAQLLDEQSLLAIANFEFRYSAVNKRPDSMLQLGYAPIDIKNQGAIKWVIASFDLILSIHCKQIFPLEVVSNICCVNVHPGFNPYNRGWYPQIFSIINKMPIGATIHLMSNEIDSGPIIAQQRISVNSCDTSLSLYEKVQDAEIILLERYIGDIVSGNFKYSGPPIAGNYNSIGDFKALCHLDLDSIGSLREHIDLLRALSHGDLNNAYFIDECGQKIFIKIQLVSAEN